MTTEQMTLLPDAASPDEYLEFCKKFEAKKTTDDCYTPPAVYAAVCDWAVAEYELQGRRILRPFHPCGDYQAVDYQPGDVVIDNPPFSMLAQIVRFYQAKAVPFFLFAPTLTLFSPGAVAGVCSIVADAKITYENGADVHTYFLTNLDRRYKVRTAPALREAIRLAVDSAKVASPLPVYSYPQNVITAARLNKLAVTDLAIPFEQCSDLVRALQSQRAAKKALFGGGFLISDAMAAEVRAAEVRAARNAVEWPQIGRAHV